MGFIEKIKEHAKRVADFRDHARTEEATKTSLIMPFFQILGYDPSDPRVVIPEYTADFGKKKAAKVDFAIKRGDNFVLIVEAKKVGDPLDGTRESQLQQYFQSLLPVKIGLLTDGVIYKFYTDLNNPNMMDKNPFLVFNFSAIDEGLIPELQKLCNDCFDLDAALNAAQELQYLGMIKQALIVEMDTPSDDMVRLFARRVYDGKVLTAAVMEAFRKRVKIAFSRHTDDVFMARVESLKASAAKSETEATIVPGEDSYRDSRASITEEEEKEGFQIVKAIMSKVVDPARVVMRDAASYCAILLDDKNTKPICRLHFNAVSVRYIETFDAEKKGTKHRIEKVSDIYQHEELLRVAAALYGTV